MSPQKRTGLLVLAVFGGLFLLISLGVIAAAVSRDGTSGTSSVSAASKPRADREGLTWTHKELLEYLNGRGMSLSLAPITSKSALGGPSAFFYEGDNSYALEERFGYGNSPAIVMVKSHDNERAAREDAGVRPDGFSWGRFVITGNQKGLAGRIRAALTG